MKYELIGFGDHYAKPKIRSYNVPDKYSDRASFYGKAKIVECADGIYLQSYNTLICFKSNDGKFIKLWSGYSHTTMRHINTFIYHYCGCGRECCGKAFWNLLECNREYQIKDGKITE